MELLQLRSFARKLELKLDEWFVWDLAGLVWFYPEMTAMMLT